MKLNVGSLDRIGRLLLGLVVLSAIFWVEGPVRWVGLVGLVFIGTAAVRWCPIYAVLRLNTCSIDTQAHKPS